MASRAAKGGRGRASYTHAGGVVVRERGGAREYLVVRSSKGDSWVLPKGHVEPGERPEETARREVREEAGVEATPMALVGEDRYERLGKEVRVAYFLMRFERLASPTERREQAWLSAEAARKRLTHARGRSLVLRAERMLDEGKA